MNRSTRDLTAEELHNLNLSESDNNINLDISPNSSRQTNPHVWGISSGEHIDAWQAPASNDPLHNRIPPCTYFKSGAELNLFEFIIDKDTAQRSGLALTICTVTSTGKYLLVDPNLAKGAFGQASVWLDAADHKLYVRKVQRERYAGEEPKDGTHHFDHPSVPQLVSNMDHGPQPSDMNPYGNSAFSHRVWTTITEYIDGFSLENTIERHEERGIWIPEAEIWACAAALLDIIIKMRHPDPGAAKAMIHHDIYPRNVIVEPIQSAQRKAKYWLIDFGLATREGEENHKTSRDDVFAVSQLIFAMMSRAKNRDLWNRVHVRNQISHSAPYSPYLFACACRLQDEAIEAAENQDCMSKARMEFWLNICKAQTDEKSVDFSQLCTKTVPMAKKPVLIWDETQTQFDAEITMGFLNEEIWGPYRYAWIDKNTLELKFLEPFVLWGKKIPVFRAGEFLSENHQW